MGTTPLPSIWLSACFLVIFFLAPPFGCSCPLLQQDLCRIANTTSPASWQCGEHAVRCSGSVRQISFYGEGQWCIVKHFSVADRVLVARDEGVNSILSHYDCGILYSFTSPEPLLPRPSAFQENLLSGFYTFTCEVNTFNFSKDAFAAAYNASRCSGFDLYYAYEYEGQLPRDVPSDCTDTVNSRIFEWKLRLDESGRNLLLLSAGISHQRVLRPDCFNCRMSRRDCSPLPVGNSTACSCAKTCPDPASKKGANRGKLIIGAAISGFTLLIMILVFCCLHGRLRGLWIKWRSKDTECVEEFLDQYGAWMPKRYSYFEVRKMTKSFGNKLGEGGYGKVFQGKLDNGRQIAVKILDKSNGSGKEFMNEVASIGKTYHINIVRLLGFCSEGNKRALIYEFMPNGSLDKLIFSQEPRESFQWKLLYEIAVGVARGLEYLHNGCKIVHFDIKPHNILLDENLHPKISDFGLARLCRPRESVLSMAGTRGTIGYIAPEVFSRTFGAVSSKSDVYSYGMMLLEMVSRRRNADGLLEKSTTVYFPHWVHEQLVNGGSLRFLDTTSETADISKKMILIGLWCIQTNPKSRPSMTNVVEMLQGSIDHIQLPPRPYLSSPKYSPSSTLKSS